MAERSTELIPVVQRSYDLCAGLYTSGSGARASHPGRDASPGGSLHRLYGGGVHANGATGPVSLAWLVIGRAE